MAHIPNKIIHKLEQIEKAQNRVKMLLQDIEDHYPVLADTWDAEDNWTFSMYIDKQGSVASIAESLKLLDRFLEQARV